MRIPSAAAATILVGRGFVGLRLRRRARRGARARFAGCCTRRSVGLAGRRNRGLRAIALGAASATSK